MARVRMPSAGRRTRPSVTRSLSTALAVLMGMAKPMPEFCAALPMIMVLMPITSPRESSSGPPELPGLMAASVWMASSMKAPSGERTERMELTIPRVMVPVSPKGLPMANTFCPTTRCEESPRVTGTRSGAEIWMTARSWERSRPTILAGYLRRLASVTSIWRAPSTTWKLVRMCPCLSRTKPEPWPCAGTAP